MELWLVYAFIASVSIGINGYLIKLIANRNIDGAVLTCIQGIVYLVLGLSQSIFTGGKIFSYDHLGIISLSALVGILVFMNLRFRIQALKHLSTSEYFIGYRILMTLLLLGVGILFLQEHISSLQIFGLALGSFAIIFLFEEDLKLRKSRNWNKALFYLSLSIIAGGLLQVFGKIQGLADFPMTSLFFYQGIIMLVITLLFDRVIIEKNIRALRENTKVFLLTLCASCFTYIAATFNLLAYTYGGSVSIVTKIMAYSIFISIGFSILFRKEVFTKKKGIAFILTIISIYYLN